MAEQKNLGWSKLPGERGLSGNGVGGNGEGMQLRREKVVKSVVISAQWGQEKLLPSGGPAFASDLAKCKVAVDAAVVRELLVISGIEVWEGLTPHVYLHYR